MRCAVISDIHGNLPALTAVLRQLEKERVDTIHCLGDVIGYGSKPSDCLRLVEQNCDVKVLGNHEYVTMGRISLHNYNPAARAAVIWTKERMTDEDMAMIRRYEITSTRADLFFVHASPYEPQQWHYIVTVESACQAFACFDQKLCFSGHSHIPQLFIEVNNGWPTALDAQRVLLDESSRYVINVGSVGQPRDGDPRACAVIYDSEHEEIAYRRIAYDVAAAQAGMSQVGLPDSLIARLEVGR